MEIQVAIPNGLEPGGGAFQSVSEFRVSGLWASCDKGFRIQGLGLGDRVLGITVYVSGFGSYGCCVKSKVVSLYRVPKNRSWYVRMCCRKPLF